MKMTAYILVLLSVSATALAQGGPANSAGTGSQAPVQPTDTPVKPDAPLYSTPNQNVSPETVQPDQRPLSGAQPFSLGISGRKEMRISLTGSQSWDSNPSVTSGTGNGFASVTTAGGYVSIDREVTGSQTTLSYSGNMVHYTNTQPSFSTLQSLNASQNFQLGRWSLTGADTFTYVPNSLLGGSSFLPMPTGDTAVIKPQYLADQSILTPYGAQYSNSVLGQLGYGLSRRTSLTASGTYGFSKFVDFSLYDFNQASGTAGYNYSLSAKDTVAVSYTYSLYRYENFNSEFHTQSVQLSYGRRVAGRLSFQAGGGPQFITSGGLTAAENNISYSGNAGLTYQRNRDSLSISYFTGATAGAGVLYGANTSSVQFSFSREFSRNWSGSTTVGYTRNSDLTNSSRLYQGVFFSGNLHWAFQRSAGIGFNYNYQHQLSDNCVGLACGDVNRNIAGISFDWSFRPINLE